MRIILSRNAEELGKRAGTLAADRLREAIREKGKARLILSTGASQFETLDTLVTADLPWAQVELFHLDEYIGLSETHPASFRRYLRERVLARAPIGLFHPVDGERDVEAGMARLSEELLREPVDVALIGIGENGHIAFNDPPADFTTTAPYLSVALDEACRRQQLREGWFPTFADVPERAITMSVHRILQSRCIISAVPHAVKAAAVRATLGGSVSPSVPATALKSHPDVTLFLDVASASLTDENVMRLYMADARPGDSISG